MPTPTTGVRCEMNPYPTRIQAGNATNRARQLGHSGNRDRENGQAHRTVTSGSDTSSGVVL